jgi:hypothetical protein
MKTQLLEDIGGNGSVSPATGPLEGASAPAVAPVPPQSAAPAAAPAPAPAAPARPATPAGPPASLLERAVAAPLPPRPVAPAQPPDPPSPVPPAEPAAERRGPAVWHRPQSGFAAGATEQRSAGQSMQRAPAPDAADPILQRLAQRPPEPPTEPLPAPDPVLFAPQPPYFEAPVRDEPTPVRDGPPPFGGQSPFAAEAPDWLAARLQEDAALRDDPQWSSLWKRRLVTWSIAAGLLAMLAAGALWVVQETRVEGALSVVANTSPVTGPAGAPALVRTAPLAAPPAAAGAAIRPVTAPADPAAPSPAPVEVPATPSKPEAARPEAAATDAADADPRTVVSVTIPPAAVPDVNVPVRHTARRERERAAARQRRTVASSQPKAPAEPTGRQRREETLLQCRAHGYNERQCIQRGCVMTRFGLACKG